MILLLSLLVFGRHAAAVEQDAVRWTQVPSPAELESCRPRITEAPTRAEVEMTCRVEAGGRLSECRAAASDPRLEPWGLCFSRHLVAAEPHRGGDVRFTIRWRGD